MRQSDRFQMMNTIDRLLAAGKLTGGPVYAFGRSNATEEMIDFLLERGVAVQAILDNNEAKQGQCYLDIPVCKPEAAAAQGGGFVLIASRAYDAMAAQLARLGYRGEVVRVIEFDTFSEYSLSQETFDRRLGRAQRGIRTLEQIRERKPDACLVVCPYDALGDVYWAMAFLPSYCKAQGIASVTVAVSGEGCAQVARLFGVVDAFVLAQDAMDELVQAMLFTDSPKSIIAHHDRPYTDRIINYLDGHFMSFIDYYRLAVYGLPFYTAAAEPRFGEAFMPPAGLEQGVGVLLAPHSRSVPRVPHSFWEEQAAGYRQAGYTVFTNVAGDEKPVRGTQPIRIGLGQIIAAAEYIGHFVGIRSGLCDLIHTARCQKTVVFPDYAYSTTNVKADRFFDLPGWQKIVWRA